MQGVIFFLPCETHTCPKVPQSRGRYLLGKEKDKEENARKKASTALSEYSQAPCADLLVSIPPSLLPVALGIKFKCLSWSWGPLYDVVPAHLDGSPYPSVSSYPCSFCGKHPGRSSLREPGLGSPGAWVGNAPAPPVSLAAWLTEQTPRVGYSMCSLGRLPGSHDLAPCSGTSQQPLGLSFPSVTCRTLCCVLVLCL